jgi:hypothetical protein
MMFININESGYTSYDCSNFRGNGNKIAEVLTWEMGDYVKENLVYKYSDDLAYKH